MRKVLLVLVPIVLLAAGAVGALYFIRTKPSVEPSPPTERVWTVDSVPVRLTDIQPEIQLFGKIFAARQIQIRALVTGQIVEIHPNLVEGGLIRRGETILAIDEFEYRSALKESEARLAEARARIVEREAKRRAETKALTRDREILALLDRDLKRATQLRKRGNISIQSLDKKRLEMSRQQRAIVLRQNGIDAETARLKQEKATIERLDVAVQRARYDLERTRVRAPFDGVFLNVTAQAGQRLDTAESVGSLIATGRLEARFHLSDAQYGRLTSTERGVIGRKARVVWRVGQRRLDLKAVVARVGAQIDTASGGVELFARIENREAASSLRPGAFVEVHVPDRIYANVARVPETVLHPGNVVYGVEDGRLVARQSKVVGRVGNDVLLRGGLSNGERLVTTQSVAMAPGLRVELR
ncbi:MAG: efflux RND transporter periplasmic adaptor subunit [Gammaproteobacteria bacterium]|nr:efflux RND transporter periplasmic adaptor subunit [Gammaproteobacteria bacterium]